MAGKEDEGQPAAPAEPDAEDRKLLVTLSDFLRFAVGPLKLTVDEFLRMTWGEFYARAEYYNDQCREERLRFRKLLTTTFNAGYHIKNFIRESDLWMEDIDQPRATDQKKNRERYVELSKKWKDVKFLGVN